MTPEDESRVQLLRSVSQRPFIDILRLALLHKHFFPEAYDPLEADVELREKLFVRASKALIGEWSDAAWYAEIDRSRWLGFILHRFFQANDIHRLAETLYSCEDVAYQLEIPHE